MKATHIIKVTDNTNELAEKIQVNVEGLEARISRYLENGDVRVYINLPVFGGMCMWSGPYTLKESDLEAAVSRMSPV